MNGTASSHLLPLPEEPARDLGELFARYSRCYRCPLAYTRRRIIQGTGNPDGGLALVTDRVAGLDEQEGRLLSGPVGDLQERILAAPEVEIPRERVYLACVVLCRGPRDRMPRAREINACTERLRRELVLVRPRIIVALGMRAGIALLGDRVPSPGPHRWLSWSDGDQEVPVWVTLHPRDAVWGTTSEIRRRKRVLYDDWLAISARFRELGGVSAEGPVGGEA